MKNQAVREKINLFDMSVSQRQKLMYKWSKRLWTFFRAALLIGLGYVLIYPVLYMVSMGFRDVQDIYDVSVKWIPKHITLDNFIRVWQGMEYPKALGRTVITSLGSAILLVISCSMTAYGLSRFKFWGSNIIFILVLLTIIVPQQFFVLPSYLNFRFFTVFGVLDIYNIFADVNKYVPILGSYATFLLPALFGIGIRSGLYIYIFRQFFKGLPKELEEASYIDGCGFIRTFINIIVPSAVPAFVTVFLFALVWNWNDYQLATMYMSENKTLSSTLVMLGDILYSKDATAGIQTIDPNRITMDMQIGSLLVVTPVIALYLVAQRYFTESIERTGLVE